MHSATAVIVRNGNPATRIFLKELNVNVLEAFVEVLELGDARSVKCL